MTTSVHDVPKRAAMRGPVRTAERALAPDLARGVMLLFIAAANAAGVVSAGQPGAGPHLTGVERAVNLFMFTVVHARAYPVFAVMFGYGLVQLARRQEAAGATPEEVRSLLLRRNLWLLVFGFLHAALLYYGDFLGAYGLVGIVATTFLLRRGARVERVVLWFWGASALHVCVLAGLVCARVLHGATGHAVLPMDEVASFNAPDYVSSIVARLHEWPVHTATVLPFIVIVWLGMWAARRRMLEEHARHSRTLRTVATVGLGMAFAGGLPLGLFVAGLLPVDQPTLDRVFLLHQASGMFAGPAYVALAGLGAARLTGTPTTRVLEPVAALGRRSLSAYLFQSVMWLLLFSPFTLALGGRWESPTLAAAAVALLVWSVSLVGARMLDRNGNPGPAEAVLRRLTYGTVARARDEGDRHGRRGARATSVPG